MPSLRSILLRHSMQDNMLLVELLYVVLAHSELMECERQNDVLLVPPGHMLITLVHGTVHYVLPV